MRVSLASSQLFLLHFSYFVHVVLARARARLCRCAPNNEYLFQFHSLLDVFYMPYPPFLLSLAADTHKPHFNEKQIYWRSFQLCNSVGCCLYKLFCCSRFVCSMRCTETVCSRWIKTNGLHLVEENIVQTQTTDDWTRFQFPINPTTHMPLDVRAFRQFTVYHVDNEIVSIHTTHEVEIDLCAHGLISPSN